MRIAVISDIHGNLAALEAVAADIRRRGVDRVINLGDSLSGPLLPKETAQFLMERDWFHLAGNHERALLTLSERSSAPDRYAHSRLSANELAWVATLSPRADYEDGIFACHGTPDSDHEALLQTADRPATCDDISARLGGVTAALVLCGHSHVPRSVRHRRQLIVNPGSVGLPAFADDYPYPHAIENGSPDARYALLEKTADGWTSALLAVPYDHEKMAQLARLRGLPDWECALLTGYTLQA